MQLMVAVAATGLVEEVARWWGSSSRRFVLGGLFLEIAMILSTTAGSVMTEMIFIFLPHLGEYVP